MCYYSAFSIKRIPSVPTSKVAFPFTTGIEVPFEYASLTLSNPKDETSISKIPLFTKSVCPPDLIL